MSYWLFYWSQPVYFLTFIVACAIPLNVVLRTPRFAIRQSEIAVLAVAATTVTTVALFGDGPKQMFSAPFGYITFARNEVERLGGTFAEIERGHACAVKLAGGDINDEELRSLADVLVDYSSVHLELTKTAVSCSGARQFRRSIPKYCEVRTDIVGCFEIGP